MKCPHLKNFHISQAITQALTLPESHAAVFLQTQINNTFKLST